MRNLELALGILLFANLLLPLLLGRRPRWLNTLPILAALVMLAHLLLEGYRWQMIPLYVLCLLELAAAALRLLRYPTAAIKLGRFQGGLLILGLLVTGAGLLLPALFPIPALPAPTGPYSIGT